MILWCCLSAILLSVNIEAFPTNSQGDTDERLCTFEDSDPLCFLEQDNTDDSDWKKAVEVTEVKVDTILNVQSYSGSSHMYIDHTNITGFPGNKQNFTARLTSNVDFTSIENCLILFYYMYGCDTGDLKFKVERLTSDPEIVFEKSGSQGNMWHKAVIPFTIENNMKIFIEAVVQTNGTEASIAIDEVSLYNTTCAIDGGYSEWSEYSECSATCNGGTQNRTRTCTNPPPSGTGQDCQGPATEQRDCNTHVCNIDGGYSEWSEYSECSAACNGGTQNRTRTCTNPPPSGTGQDCQGPATEQRDCNTHVCNIDGGYSEWSEYSECSASCNGGTQNRTRTCTNPPPSGTGQDCQGPATEQRDCNTHVCNIDGGYSEWSEYSECSASCNGGTQNHTRTCSNPPPSGTGLDCQGPATEQRDCNTHVCNIDGGYSEWSEYSECSASCNGGTQNRTRTCTNPPPSGTGQDCQGPATEQRDCNTHVCNIDGGYSEWSEYSECSASCNGGTQNRTRTCTNPPPSGTGLDCQGPATEQRDCNTHVCNIDGGYSEWSEYSECSATCNGGTQIRTRTCTNPPPSGTGLDCQGPATDERDCNTHVCNIDGGWSEWSQYSECSVPCNGGTQTRTRTCTNPPQSGTGLDCQGPATEQRICNDVECLCTFEESDPHCWLIQDETDNFDWRYYYRSTPTRRTGPTAAKNGQRFAYIEASSPRVAGDRAKLLNSITLQGTKQCLSMYYHMYGRHIGDLRVKIRTQGQSRFSTVFYQGGNKGNEWYYTTVEIPISPGLEISIEGVRGYGIYGDIALDDVKLLEGGCP